MPVTYYVAMPFSRGEDGDLVVGEAQDRQSAAAAVKAAEAMALEHGGAVAFSRTGDPDSGQFDDAVILATFGDVPSVDQLTGES